jgi:predicted transcriptional regulator
MRFPNLRYGNPTEFEYYCMGRPLAEIARVLRRDERTIRDWLSGRAKLPWWVPEIMRLQRMELVDRQRQMFGHIADQKRLDKLGIVRPNAVLELRRRPEKKKPQITDLRLDDFDEPHSAAR